MSRVRLTIRERDTDWRRIEAGLRQLSGAEVTVGIQGTEDSELVKIATINEFGSEEWTITSKQAYFMARRLMQIDPEVEPGRFWATFRTLRGKKMRIPERSFIRAGFDTNRAALKEAMRRSFDRVIRGEATGDEQLRRFGEFAQALIQGYLIDLNQPANAPLTRFVKQSNNPLVDTGRLHASIRYIVKRQAGARVGASGPRPRDSRGRFL